MIIPIKERNTVLYGNNGKYKLIKKDGNYITYEFEPWDKNMVISDKGTIEELRNIIGHRIIWAVYEDIPDIK